MINRHADILIQAYIQRRNCSEVDINVILLQVNINGAISFGSALPTYPSEILPVRGTAFIAPFWADIDTSANGSVYYRYNIIMASLCLLL